MAATHISCGQIRTAISIFEDVGRRNEWDEHLSLLVRAWEQPALQAYVSIVRQIFCRHNAFGSKTYKVEQTLDQCPPLRPDQFNRVGNGASSSPGMDVLRKRLCDDPRMFAAAVPLFCFIQLTVNILAPFLSPLPESVADAATEVSDKAAELDRKVPLYGYRGFRNNIFIGLCDANTGACIIDVP